MRAALLAVLGLLTAVTVVPMTSAVIYKCVDEPPYVGAPDYSGDFCVDGQLGADCLVIHHWTDQNGPGERCYVPSPLGPGSS